MQTAGLIPVDLSTTKSWLSGLDEHCREAAYELRPNGRLRRVGRIVRWDEDGTVPIVEERQQRQARPEVEAAPAAPVAADGHGEGDSGGDDGSGEDADAGEDPLPSRSRSADAGRDDLDELDGTIVAIARRYARDPAEADDLAQEARLAVWVASHQYDSTRGPLRRYLLRVAGNAIRSALRRDLALKRGRTAIRLDVESAPGLDSNVEDQLDARRRLDRLGGPERALCLAVASAGSVRQAARRLHTHRSTVYRALARLREARHG